MFKFTYYIIIILSWPRPGLPAQDPDSEVRILTFLRPRGAEIGKLGENSGFSGIFRTRPAKTRKMCPQPRVFARCFFSRARRCEKAVQKPPKGR